MTLKEKLKELPNSAGVYQYFDKNGHLLYIGKAKNLKNRVKSYFKFTPALTPADKLGSRIFKMISEVESLEYIVVPNEHDALILENSLIKQLKPKYNILLRDDKTYPYIYIDFNEEFPRLEITRRVIKGKNIKYFGPYSTGARDMLDSIYEIVPLVQKKSCIKGGEACLFYQIGKCLAPCEGKISTNEYKKLIGSAVDLISNKSKMIKKLTIKMEELSEQFRFEEAKVIRDRIKNIEKSKLQSTLDFARQENLDLFAIKENNHRAVIVKMFIRDGKLISSSHSYIKIDNDFDEDEAYKRAIINYYTDELPLVPTAIILPKMIEDKESIEEFLFNRFNKKLELVTPKRGKKKELVKVALNNCDELLRIDSFSKQISLYEEIKNLFGLQRLPYRIESFDNSHMMGQAIVGAMTVWEEKFVKTEYRHYNLKALDEYGQMREMLSRRVESFDKNPPPDLWVIDGGAALLTLAHNILDSVGVNIDVIAIAKEKINARNLAGLARTKAHRAKGAAKDMLYYATAKKIETKKDKKEDKSDKTITSLKLLPSDKRLQFVQRLRDEAHRFAITFHKKQKRAQDKQISLLQIKGIGEAKVKKLLNYFGTFETLKNATLDDLKEVLSEKDAKMILEHF